MPAVAALLCVWSAPAALGAGPGTTSGFGRDRALVLEWSLAIVRAVRGLVAPDEGREVLGSRLGSRAGVTAAFGTALRAPRGGTCGASLRAARGEQDLPPPTTA